MRKCIFHIPNHIDDRGQSGSNVRPVKMMKAFQLIGYDVDCIMGYGEERKRKISEVKENINKGIKYDFMYSESSTMPTLLTEANHIPRYPCLDFGFMKFCQKKGIRIGLFYRDIQWKFDIYKRNVAWYKKCVSMPMYRYDLYKYGKLLDKFYLTSPAVGKYLKEYPKLLKKMDSLPPGCEKVEMTKTKQSGNSKLKIFYVGGISKIYDLSLFLKVIYEMPDIEMILCCREKEWTEDKKYYEEYITSRIKIVHKTGKELEEFYEWADICCAFAGIGEYMSMAMPIKVFEYLGHLKPMIGTRKTEAGNFIQKNKIGWSVEYTEASLKECLNNIVSRIQILFDMKKILEKVREENLWTVRAKKVAQDLTQNN